MRCCLRRASFGNSSDLWDVLPRVFEDLIKDQAHAATNGEDARPNVCLRLQGSGIGR